VDAEVVRFGSEPIDGWRAWRVRYDDGEPGALQSIAHGLTWPARRPMRAHCLYAWAKRRLPWPGLPKSHGSAPSLEHSCGLYATATSRQARFWAASAPSESALDQRIIGRVALWGRVLCHSRGWRAELAYPSEFVLPPVLEGGADLDWLALWLESEFGVPARVGAEEWSSLGPRLRLSGWLRPGR
jgi:hypothetical protein